jgi:hypothetical protein
MGKSILIMVLGTGLLVSLLTLSLSKNSTSQVESTTDFYKQEQARLIANSGVEIYLEKLRDNKNLTGTFLNNEFNDGTYDIYISGPDSSLKIRSIGHYENQNHTTVVKAKRDKITLPPINSSVYLSSNSLGINFNGNVDIDGRDHDIDGTLTGNTPLPGIGVDSPSDSSYIINNVKPKVSYSIQGEGGAPSVKTVTDTTDWKQLTEDIIFASDITLPTGTYSTGAFGTNSEPKITYVTGDVHFSGTVIGAGIMVVNGNLTLSGQFNYDGIILVYGNSNITTKVVGQGSVVGATICVGQSINIQATGNSKLYYSKEAIDNARANLKSSRFTITSWWE